MANVTVTLTSDMVLSENARARVTAYRKKGDTVSFNNQLDEGVQQIAVVGNTTYLT